jgi:hypothetical protein
VIVFTSPDQGRRSQWLSVQGTARSILFTPTVGHRHANATTKRTSGPLARTFGSGAGPVQNGTPAANYDGALGKP